MATKKRVALVAGVTGLVGRELVKSLLSLKSQWDTIYGAARQWKTEALDHFSDPAYHFVDCDFLDGEYTLRKLSPLAGQITHLFWVTWASQCPRETTEGCNLNRSMLSNVLDALLLPTSNSSLSHVSLQTGTGHYVSFQVPKFGSEGDKYYDESSPRVVVDGGGEALNFYYTLEDLLRERLARRRIGWSVHRPGLLLGVSTRSHFNFVGTLCVYGSICRHLGLPFTFYGDRKCWEQPCLDASDARLVADQLIWWASLTHCGHLDSQGQAFNAVNCATYTWSHMWPALSSTFCGGDDGGFSEEKTYMELMGDKGDVWGEMVHKYRLRPTRMEEMANWGLLDTVFRFPVNLLVNRNKAYSLGFTTVHDVDPSASILYWVDRMTKTRLIPHVY
ncbi:putative delta(4)-3-oxosteroid 5-beta-reductase [Dioscorea sansibarensis]